MKIKLTSKRLHSGKCQVRFQVAEEGTGASWYGYALAEPKETLKEVVKRIEGRIAQRLNGIAYKVQPTLKDQTVTQSRLMIFRDN
jgi:hypothetical protein